MDELKIKTGFMKKIIGGIISKTVKKKVGIDAMIKVEDLDFTFDEKTAHIRLSIEGDIPKDDLNMFMKKII